MKKFLSLSVALLAVAAGFAQTMELDPADNVQVAAPVFEQLQADNANRHLAANETSMAPKHSKATGLYYLPPRGMYRSWRPIVDKGWGMSYMLVPPFTEFTCINMSTNKEGNLWHGNYVNTDPITYRDWTSLADEDGNWKNTLSLPNYYCPAPTLVNAEQTDSFTLSRYNQYWIKESYPTYNTRFYAAQADTTEWCSYFDDHLKTSSGSGIIYWGWSSAHENYYLLGSGNFNLSVKAEDGTTSTVVCKNVSVQQRLPKPIKPFYSDRIALKVLSTNVDTPIIPEGKYVYIDIINTETGESIATLKADQSNFTQINTFTGGDPAKTFCWGWLFFESTQVDAFGNEVSVPIIIDCDYTIKVHGIDQEGVNVGCYVYKPQDQDSFYSAQFELEDPNGEKQLRYWNSGYTLCAIFKGLFDNTKVRTEASFYTDDTKTETEIRGDLNIMQISDDGTTCSNGTQSYAVVYTAFDWMDSEGTEFYYLLDENDEIPTWLNYTVDNSSYESYKYSKIKFTAEPLPEGVAGRGVYLYAVSDKGAKSEDPIFVYQGDHTAGIEGVNITDVKTNKDNKIFNVLGQRVSNVQSGLYIKNGKKFIKK